MVSVRLLALVGALALALAVPAQSGARLEEPDVRTRPHFVPATRLVGERVILPITFPDGTRAELHYPPGLLRGLSIRPYGSGGWSCEVSCWRDFSVLYRDESPFRAGRVLKGRFPGANGGRVELWEWDGREEDVEPTSYLVFRFGPWRVGVWDDYMGAEELSVWARSLAGRVTRGGYLVLEARPPLRLARAGEHAGPELMLEGRRGIVRLFPGRCRRHEREPERSRGFTSWCAPEASMRVHVYGSRGFGAALLEGLEIRNAVPAGS
jgi:hypothetical protein